MKVVIDLVEAVHVELADKRGDVCVLEVEGEDFGKFFSGGNDKRVVGRGPGDEVSDKFILEHTRGG